MLLDPTTSYDPTQTQHLVELWQKIVLHIASSHTQEKILMSLSKVGILAIDETKKEVIF